MSSDDVEASTSDVNSSSDFIDKIVQSVLDSEIFNLPEYYPEELLRLATTEDAFDRNAETKNDSVSVDGCVGANCSSHSICDKSSYRNCEDDENLCRCCSASGRICQVVDSEDCRKKEIVASVSTSGKDSFTYNCFTGERSHELHSIIARERGRAAYLALQLRHIMETVRSLYVQRGALDIYSQRANQLNELMRRWSVNLNMFDVKKPIVLYRL
jgi:hypothetical protein